MLLFDSHCHLDDPRIQRLLPALIADSKAAGIGGFLVPGVAPEGWQEIASLSSSYACIASAFGVHPMHADLLVPAVLSELRQLCGQSAAIGEIGLDYAIDAPPPEVQRGAFRSQLRLALDNDLPVLIHCRKAFPDLLAILAEESGGNVRGVMHAFSGSPETAHECLRLGLHVSFAGSVTFLNAIRPVAVAQMVPLERLLLETDAPDLAPEPYRGQINLPSYLPLIARRVAELKGLTVEELAAITTQNAVRLFRLGPNLGWPAPPEV